MGDSEKSGLSGTVCLHPESPEGGTIVHRDGDHQCVGGYRYVREGYNVAGQTVLCLHKDGRFEQVPTGAPRRGSSSGPAQVATPTYRDSWERTCGANGGIS